MENPEITDEFLKKYAVEIDGVFYFAKAFASPVANRMVQHGTL